MRRIDVVCGVLKNVQGQYLLTQRGPGAFHGKWEFPGGKVEDSESYKESIIRELQEELNIIVEAGDVLYQELLVFENQELNLVFIECWNIKGIINLTEHIKYGWFDVIAFSGLDIIEGDKGFIKQLLSPQYPLE